MLFYILDRSSVYFQRSKYEVKRIIKLEVVASKMPSKRCDSNTDYYFSKYDLKLAKFTWFLRAWRECQFLTFSEKITKEAL